MSGVQTNLDKMLVARERRRDSAVGKYEGDDCYSWALFVRGRPVYTGMSITEAKWRRDRYIAEGAL